MNESKKIEEKPIVKKKFSSLKIEIKSKVKKHPE